MNKSKLKVFNISSRGIWLSYNNRKLFLSYENFPWFKDQPIKSVLFVEEPSKGHFYWPDLDIDLSIESIKHPDRFPLMWNK